MNEKKPTPTRETEEAAKNQPSGLDLPMSAEDEAELMKLGAKRSGSRIPPNPAHYWEARAYQARIPDIKALADGGRERGREG